MSSTSELYREALDGFALAPEVKARMVTRLVAALENEGEVGGADPTMPECSVRVPFASHPSAVSGLAPSPSGRLQRAVLPCRLAPNPALCKGGCSAHSPSSLLDAINIAVLGRFVNIQTAPWPPGRALLYYTALSDKICHKNFLFLQKIQIFSPLFPFLWYNKK